MTSSTTPSTELPAPHEHRSFRERAEDFFCTNATSERLKALNSAVPGGHGEDMISCADFITAMALVVGVMLALLVILVVCLLRYPSYATHESLKR